MRQNELDNYQELMEGFRAGHNKSFTAIFNLLYTSLCNFSLKITHNQAEAEDIVEDSFIKIWQKRDIFLEFKVLKSYLYTTVKNASIDSIKKNKTILSASPNLLELYVSVPEQSDIFKYCVSTEVFARITRALDDLTPRAKQIIQLVYFEGKKIKEIADGFGVSESTIKTQKSRSILKIKNSLHL